MRRQSATRQHTGGEDDRRCHTHVARPTGDAEGARLYEKACQVTPITQMLMDPMGGIVMTNDGNAILREITVKHPAAKSMIEISRTQDEETGDGTTSVIVLGTRFMERKQRNITLLQLAK